MFHYQFNIGDYRAHTPHLKPLEHYIYRTLIDWYYLNEKPMKANVPSIARLLMLKTEEEIEALKSVLSEFFKVRKGAYHHARINQEIKNYRYRHRNDGSGNSAGNDTKSDDGNGTGNAHGNESGNALTDAERVAKYKRERKNMIKDLLSLDIKVAKNISMARLRDKHAKHFNSDNTGNDEGNKQGNAVNVTNDKGNGSGNGGNGTGNESNERGNAKGNGKNDAITINQEPLTINHKPTLKDTHTQNMREEFADVETVTNPQPTAVTKAAQIREQRSSDIENWQPPSIDDMRSELMRAGVMMQLTDDQYALHVDDFKAHYAEQARLGKPIISDKNRKSKLRRWLQREAVNQKITQTKQVSAENQVDWSSVGRKPTANDSDMPEVFHPSHSQPTQQAKPDPKTSVIVNGVWKSPLPNMSVDETYRYISNHKDVSETNDEAYDRLFNQLKRAS